MDYKTISYLTIAMVVVWAGFAIILSDTTKLQNFEERLRLWWSRIKNVKL